MSDTTTPFGGGVQPRPDEVAMRGADPLDRPVFDQPEPSALADVTDAEPTEPAEDYTEQLAQEPRGSVDAVGTWRPG